MNNPIHAIISEMEQEAAGTRRLLKRVPTDKLSWRPHPKSMTLGELALHVATVPAQESKLMLRDVMDTREPDPRPAQPKSTEEILAALEASLAEARQTLSGITAEATREPWTLMEGERAIFTIPRIGVARTILLNHWYHHRGQLTVYLRLLDVPLPPVIGPSADDSSFV